MKKFNGTKISTFMKNLNEKIKEKKEAVLEKTGDFKPNVFVK